jgi:hypothetical protein
LLGTPLSEQNRQELVEQLIATKAFHHAFELWRADRKVARPVILHGGFEELPSNPFVDRGFGWFVFGKSEAKVVVDQSQKLSGRASLLLGFNGDWKAPTYTMTQRIVVDPERRYRISFGVKTKDLVTGAPPIIVVTDAVSNERLGQSAAFPTPSSEWQTLSFDFSTMPATQAIVLTFMRAESACNPCPIFGELWLDDFLIEDVTAVNPQR